jgi:cytosine/adenosine deaminase-related metal-dependent hydrolase
VLETTEAVIAELNHANGDRTRAFAAPFVIVTSIFPSGATPPDKLHALTAHDYFQAKKIREIAVRHGTRIHSDAFGGMIHMAALDQENALLGPDVHLQHCTGLSFDETMLLAKSGTHVSCSPWNEYALERTPVVELLELGATVAISTDGCAPNSLFDLFAAMRKMQTIQQIARSDFYCLPSEKLLEMVTIDAAKCIGWEDELGSLEAGKKADVITVDMKQPHLSPLNPAFFPDYLVHFAAGSDVRDVIVDGHILMRDRRVKTVNEEAVIEASTQESLDTIRRAGLEASTKPEKKAWGQTRMYYYPGS